MRLQSYLQSALEILMQYKGDVPFAAWLKNYFKQHKKFGSRDRRLVADLCFCYYRLGGAFQKVPEDEKLLIGQFLCHEESPFVKELKPEWAEKSFSSIEEKVRLIDESQKEKIFPFKDEISPQIENVPFGLSFLQQPDLFLRLRPGKEKEVIQKLEKAGVEFLAEDDCLRLSNRTKTDEIIRIDEEAVVQDVSSQRVLDPLKQDLKLSSFSAWDCCAASGGKTILLHDTFPKARLTVSDIRESIIMNLKNRLKRAGIHQYHSFVADVSAAGFKLDQRFDVIVCDAPCSGAGTWGRTPEQLRFFKKEKINDYASLQKNIAVNAIRYLKKEGYFLYITCSVFSKENEEVVSYLQANGKLRLLTQNYFKGWDKKGDTLFAALFTTL